MRLPIDEVLPEIVKTLRTNAFTVLQAPPGAGKSTRVPPALLDAELFEGEIWVLEPRRIAARSLAERMAYERNEKVGESIGYRVRFDSKVGKNTRIVVVTEGILTRRFLQDPLLEGISCIVLDEFHERSIHGDLSLGFSKVLADIREDLRVLVMSATLDGKSISRFLDDAPVITAHVAPFEVDVHHAQKPDNDIRALPERCAKAVLSAIARSDDDEGDVLVFLPGAAEIHRCERALLDRTKHLDVFCLYGSLKKEVQDQVFLKRSERKGQKRRIVLATNIAETSLTLPEVTTVIDSGKVKRLSFDAKKGSDTLKLETISKQSAIQRRGRAGRNQKGRAFCLYSAREEASFLGKDPPEITRVEPSSTALMLAQFAPGDLAQVPLLDRPQSARFERALKLLEQLQLLENETLTPLGEAAAKLPVHPRLARVLLYARDKKCSQRAALLCAILSEAPRTELELDELCDAVENGHRRDGFANIRRVQEQLVRAIKAPARDEGYEPDASLLLPGFIDRLCRQAKGEQSAKQMTGQRVRWAQNQGDEFFLALLYRPSSKNETLVSHALSVSEELLRNTFDVKLSVDIEFDEKQRPEGVKRERIFDLVISEKRNVKIPPEQMGDVLYEQCASQLDSLFTLSKEHEAFFARMRFAQKNAPELLLPSLDDEAQKRRLRVLVRGQKNVADVKKSDIFGLVTSEFDYQVRKEFDARFPPKLTLPSQKSFSIDYAAALSAPHLPLLAIRIQEIFGVKEHPCINRNQTPLLLHLLAPNRRPAQVTQDLPGFWAGSYEAVRKDLRARYPKHSWPDDPQDAPPEHRPKRRKR